MDAKYIYTTWDAYGISTAQHFPRPPKQSQVSTADNPVRFAKQHRKEQTKNTNARSGLVALLAVQLSQHQK